MRAGRTGRGLANRSNNAQQSINFRAEINMSAEIITVGDIGTHGAVVITGSPTSKIRGRAIAREGDLVNCPAKYPDGRPHGINRIVRVSGTSKVGGTIMARAGDGTECGCVLMGSPPARA